MKGPPQLAFPNLLAKCKLPRIPVLSRNWRIPFWKNGTMQRKQNQASLLATRPPKSKAQDYKPYLFTQIFSSCSVPLSNRNNQTRSFTCLKSLRHEREKAKTNRKKPLQSKQRLQKTAKHVQEIVIDILREIHDTESLKKKAYLGQKMIEKN